MDYSIQKTNLYPLLFPVASGILCTASTAPVECVFSASGKVTRGKRNRLSDDKNCYATTKPVGFKVQGNAAIDNVNVNIILCFGTTKTRTLELGLELNLELELDKQLRTRTRTRTTQTDYLQLVTFV